jgi:glyoxylase-like metal-dependent hydrolase (beta-lactamase superfamily II)
MIHVLDLHFLNYEHAIASFLIESSDGPILIETGPYSTHKSLVKALADLGFELKDIKHVLLTHIHFDHAGGAWALAEQGATIYVHPFGARHLAAPTKLYESARMIYGEEMERLWGDMRAIPTEQIHETLHNETLEIGNVSIKALHTPGHAKHHIAWLFNETLFTGDVAGVKIDNGPVLPPCPPPDINIEEWIASIDLIEQSPAKSLYLTHYGCITGIDTHLQALKAMLEDWSIWVKDNHQSGQSIEEMTPKFKKYTRNQLIAKGVTEPGLSRYEAANPSWMSVSGLVRYWKKKEQAAGV